MAPVPNTREHALEGGRGARQRVRDHHPRSDILAIEHAAQEARGSLLGAALLHQDVEDGEHRPVLVHRPPQPVPSSLFFPLLFSCTSSRCHFPAAGRRWRRSPAAKAGPNMRHHRRMASSLTWTPRAASRSSLSR